MHLPDPYAVLGVEPADGPLEGLAAVIAGILHTSKTGKMEESELFAALAALDFREDAEHKVFGKWQDVISKKLASEQRYLTRKKEKDAHGDEIIFYSAGPRLEVEWPLEPTEAFVSDIYGREVDPERIKEKKTERGEIEVPHSAPRQPPRAKRSSSRAASGKEKEKEVRKKKSRSQFRDDGDDDDDEEDAVLFDDEDD